MSKFLPGVPDSVRGYIQSWRADGMPTNGVDAVTLQRLGYRSLEDFRQYRNESANALERLAVSDDMREFWSAAEKRQCKEQAGNFARAVTGECIRAWRRLSSRTKGERRQELLKIAKEARSLAALVKIYEREGFTTLNEGAIFLDGHPFFAGEKITREYIENWQPQGDRRDDYMRVVRRGLPVPSEWLHALARQAEDAARSPVPSEVPAQMNFHTFVCRWLEKHLERHLWEGASPLPPRIKAGIASAICNDPTINSEAYRNALKQSGKSV